MGYQPGRSSLPSRFPGAGPMKPIRAGLVALVTILLSACATFGPRDVNISLAQLQEALGRQLPINQRVLEFFDVRLAHPRLRLEGGRLGMTLDAAIKPVMSARSWDGNFSLSGVPRIDPVRRAVVLSEVRIEELTVNGLPPAYSRQIGRLGSVLVEQFIPDLPLYRFGPSDFQHLGTQFQATNINTGPNGLVITFEPVR